MLCLLAVLICSPIPMSISYAILTHQVAPIWLIIFNPLFNFALVIAGLWLVVGAPALFAASWKNPKLRPFRWHALMVWPLSWGLFASFFGANGGWSERRHGLIAASQRTQPLIAAIEKYRADNGQPPDELTDLVPQYIAVIPSTGMTAYPNWRYLGPTNRPRGGDYHSYELGVPTPFGLNFDVFYYWPEENYPASSSNGRIERIGKWAYLHE